MCKNYTLRPTKHCCQEKLKKTNKGHLLNSHWRLSHTQYICKAFLRYEFAGIFWGLHSGWRFYHIHCIYKVSLWYESSGAK